MWRKRRVINGKIREVRLGDVDETSYVLTEAVSAEIFLEMSEQERDEHVSRGYFQSGTPNVVRLPSISDAQPANSNDGGKHVSFSDILFSSAGSVSDFDADKEKDRTSGMIQNPQAIAPIPVNNGSGPTHSSPETYDGSPSAMISDWVRSLIVYVEPDTDTTLQKRTMATPFKHASQLVDLPILDLDELGAEGMTNISEPVNEVLATADSGAQVSRHPDGDQSPIIPVALAQWIPEEKDLKTPTETAGFIGFCLDKGAAKSVVGVTQMNALCRFFGYKFKVKPSETQFRFGTTTYTSQGTFKTRMPVNGELYLEMSIDIVHGNFPLLIGIDVILDHGLIIDYNTKQLTCHDRTWSLPIQFTMVHSFVHPAGRETRVFFTRAELEKRHFKFYPSSSGKLFNVIKRASGEKATPEIKRMLDEISRAFQTCQEYHSGPFRFRASLPADEIVFNQEVAIDLVWLAGRPVVHVVDTHTNYQNAEFVQSKAVDDLWQTFVKCWSSVYLVYPESIRLDQEASFNSESFRKYCRESGIQLKFSGVESHNSISVGERYHALRHVFNEVLEEQPRLDIEYVLRVAVKACNDTMGPEGLVPSLQVYGQLPKLPVVNCQKMKQKHRMGALRSARHEMESVVAEERIKRALRAKLPPATKYVVRPGDLLRVYREGSEKWIGPVEVVRVEDKLISVTDGVSVKTFNRTQVMPVRTNNPMEDEFLDEIYRHSDEQASIEKEQETGTPGRTTEPRPRARATDVYLTEML